MERLTSKPQAALIKCCYCEKELECYIEIGCDAVKKSFERLRDYENTGLTPEEIMDGKMLTGWIPVSERLPVGKEFETKAGKRTLYRTVLVQTDSHNMHTAYYNADEQVWRDDTGNTGLDVVAWMLLPEMFSGGTR